METISLNIVNNINVALNYFKINLKTLSRKHKLSRKRLDCTCFLLQFRICTFLGNILGYTLE